MHSVCSNKIEELSLMADGMLSMEKVKELEKHLLVCSACDSYYKDIVAMKKALKSFSLDMPDNLNELIGNAVREQSKKKKLPLHFYRYATLAAACLVLVVFFIAKGAFNKSYDTAELDNLNSSKMFEDRNSGMSSTTEGAAQLAPGEEDSVSDPAPEANLPIFTGNISEDTKYSALTDYKYTISAIENTDLLVINPDGIPLDSGYGGMQDVFYASEAYSIDEMLSILDKEFKISEVVTENENIFFLASSTMLPKLEARLGLVSAGILKEKKESLGVRIISVKIKNQ